MGLSINTDVPGLFAQRQTQRSSGLLNRALEQLSSGRRINRAADDAAGLAIAERFSARIRQGQAEINNLQSGLSLAQTAEGGLDAQQQAAQRLRDLAVQASSGTLTDGQREAINAEAQELLDEIGATAENTEFNGTQLLNQNQTIELGTEGGSQVNINDSTPQSLGIDNVDLSTQAGAQAAIGAIDQAIGQIGQNRANLGAQANRFESAINQRENSVINAQDAESRIRDLDIAQGILARSRGQLLQQSGIAGLLQGNVASQNALQLLG